MKSKTSSVRVRTVHDSQSRDVTGDVRLVRGGRQAEVVPAPSRRRGKVVEGLQPGHVDAKGEVAIANLQRRRRGAGVAVRVEGPDDLASL